MTPPRPEPGTIMNDDQTEELVRQCEAAALIMERALAPRVPAWLWFALGILVGLGLSEVWQWP